MRNLTTWTPRTLTTDTTFDRLFEDFFRPTPATQRGFTPAADIVEEKDHFVVRLDLPGFKREDLQLTVEDGTLLVRGTRSAKEEHQDASVVRSERYTGEFGRTFRLGDSIDVEKIEARYENGVLEVRIAKAEEAKPRQITVQ